MTHPCTHALWGSGTEVDLLPKDLVDTGENRRIDFIGKFWIILYFSFASYCTVQYSTLEGELGVAGFLVNYF